MHTNCLTTIIYILDRSTKGFVGGLPPISPKGSRPWVSPSYKISHTLSKLYAKISVFCLTAFYTCFSISLSASAEAVWCVTHSHQTHNVIHDSSNAYKWESSSLQKYLQTRFQWSHLMLYSLDEERCEVVDVDVSRRSCSTDLYLCLNWVEG